MVRRYLSILLAMSIAVQAAASGAVVCLGGGACHISEAACEAPEPASSSCCQHHHEDTSPTAVPQSGAGHDDDCDDCTDIAFDVSECLLAKRVSIDLDSPVVSIVPSFAAIAHIMPGHHAMGTKGPPRSWRSPAPLGLAFLASTRLLL